VSLSRLLRISTWPRSVVAAGTVATAGAAAMGVAAPWAQARLGHKKGPIPAKRKAWVKGLRA
jgi:hypothetical protein